MATKQEYLELIQRLVISVDELDAKIADLTNSRATLWARVLDYSRFVENGYYDEHV